MASHGKALLVSSKALPASGSKTYDQAMLSTSELLAQKLAQALKEKGLTQSELATLCGESKQTVYSWKKTGRIDKKHLQKFVDIQTLLYFRKVMLYYCPQHATTAPWSNDANHPQAGQNLSPT